MTITTASMVSDHSAVAILAAAREMCEPALRESVGSLPEPLNRMAGYHFGWWDVAGMPTRVAAGKALRPALAICSSGACGGAPPAAVHAAVAVELIHNFSLVHDDLIDGDRTRRGRACVWTVWGTADAILLGDALHALAYGVLADRLPEPLVGAAILRLEAAALEMCRGQWEDCAFETRPPLGVDEYVQMALGKTGALMGCACALGALCAGADEATITAMDRFGRELGLAFQFADDLIGIWGDPAVTGKPAGNDLVRRKRSLPVAAALASGSAAAVELAQLYLSETPLTTADVARAAALIDAAGGRRSAQLHADQRVAAAIAALPDLSAAADLVALAHLSARRDR
ncbi:geranylgeranyl diphosphate synthase IdsB [Nocardia suismassiliense]|uniref:Geranylgeranyl diphosphate synthase IdsB n=1 Tax=Nocardia suismassiliense TaxID=2077092 RepID=A0ABW6R7T3_9NOCA